MDDDIIFLTGHRKSGTSVFSRLFDGHPDLLVYPCDLAVFYAYFPKFTDVDTLSVTALRERLRLVIRQSLTEIYSAVQSPSLEKVDLIAANVCRQLNDEELRDRYAVLCALLSVWRETLYGETSTRPILVKETSQAVFASEWFAGSSRIKMVSLVRDPRDNFAAIKAGIQNYYSRLGEFEGQALASVINRARMDLLAAHQCSLSYPDRHMHLRFEDLTASLETTMRRICTYLSLNYADNLLTPTSEGALYGGNSHDGIQFTGLANTNIGRWKERITEDEAKVIEFWMHDAMTLHGYSCAYSPEDQQDAFARFYTWYNSAYFFSDRFSASTSDR